jgi:hypothetical protein
MIKLEGLTHKQKMLAQLIWDCDSQDQLETLIRCLPTKEDRYTASTLARMMIQETWEQERGLEEFADAAEEIIDRARGR